MQRPHLMPRAHSVVISAAEMMIVHQALAPVMIALAASVSVSANEIVSVNVNVNAKESASATRAAHAHARAHVLVTELAIVIVIAARLASMTVALSRARMLSQAVLRMRTRLCVLGLLLRMTTRMHLRHGATCHRLRIVTLLGMIRAMRTLRHRTMTGGLYPYA